MMWGLVQPATSFPYTHSGSTCGACDNYSSTDACSSSYLGGEDYVYEFTPSSDIDVTVDLTTDATYVGVIVTEGCPDTGSCIEAVTSTGADASDGPYSLSAGVTYYFTVSTFPSPDCIPNYTLTIDEAVPPDNDECLDAYPVNVNSDLNCTDVTAGTLFMAMASAQADPCTAGDPNNDVWFSFEATETYHEIEILNVSPYTDMYHAVYEGTCSSLSNISCSDPNSSSLSGLTVGNTYYIRVYSYGSTDVDTDFEVCVGTPQPPPANDECADAEPLDANPINSCDNSTAGTVEGALDSGAASSCGSTYNVDDVWYSFEALETSHMVEINNASGSYTYMYFTVYSGTCGALSEIECFTDDHGQINGLTVGATYYVSVYTGTSTTDQNTNFDICTYPIEIPENDECADAIPVPVNVDYNCTDVVSGTVTYATESSQANGCSGTANDDVWFSFEATGSEHRISLINIAGSTSDLYHAVYSGNCGSLTELNCSDPNTSDITGLTAGQTYYVRVFTWNSTDGADVNFEVCIGTPPPPPSNDECNDAIDLTINPDESCDVVTSGYTASATESSETNSCSGTSDDDVWYTFTATNDTLIIRLLNIAGTSTDMYFAVYEGSSCNSLTDVLCSDDNSAQLTGLTVGNDYMIRVYTYSTDYDASFDLCIGEPNPPGPGDVCGQSIAFCTGENYMFPASVDEPDLGSIGCLYTTPNPAWYYMEIDEPGDVVIDISSDYDVDFIAWGPFTDLTDACNNADMSECSECPNNTTDPDYYPTADIVDCSYSADSEETVTIPGAQAGEAYLLLITNYSDQITDIEFEQTSGGGTANCEIVAPPISSNTVVCTGDTLELYVTYPEPGASYSWSGPNSFSSSDMEPVIYNADPGDSGTYSLMITVDGLTSDPVTTTVEVHNPNPASVSTGDYVFRNEGTDWNAVTNWLTCTGTDQYEIASVVPSPSDNVIICAGATCASNEAIISANAYCNDLTIETDKTLTVSGSPVLEVNGNWINNGTFTPGTGTVEFNGYTLISGSTASHDFYNVTINGGHSMTAAPANMNVSGNWLNNGNFNHNNGTITFLGSLDQEINSGASSFYNITVTNSAVGLSLLDNLTVDNNLSFVNGIINTGANYTIVSNTNNDAVSGHNSESYVYGNLRRYVVQNASLYDFPVGTATAYRLIQLDNENMSGVTYLDAKFMSAFSNTDDLDPAIAIDNGTPYTSVAGEGIWQLQPDGAISGSYSINLWFDDGGGPEPFSGLVDNSFGPLKRPDGSTSAAAWSAEEGTLNADGTPGRTVAGGYAARNGLSTFSEFAIGKADSQLPIELLSFKGVCLDDEVNIKWTTASEINNDYFILERSHDNMQNFVEIAKMQGQGFSNTTKTYTFTDEKLTNGDNYYRLTQVDFDGTSESFHPIHINCDDMIDDEPRLIVYPNPFTSDVNVYVENIEDKQIMLELHDDIGKVIYREKHEIPGKSAVFPIKLDGLSNGVYYLKSYSDNCLFNDKIIKQ